MAMAIANPSNVESEESKMVGFGNRKAPKTKSPRSFSKKIPTHTVAPIQNRATRRLTLMLWLPIWVHLLRCLRRCAARRTSPCTPPLLAPRTPRIWTHLGSQPGARFANPQPQQQARRDSNPQQTVLETAALPLELLAYSPNSDLGPSASAASLRRAQRTQHVRLRAPPRRRLPAEPT